jgi:hypothetical protein
VADFCVSCGHISKHRKETTIFQIVHISQFTTLSVITLRDSTVLKKIMDLGKKWILFPVRNVVWVEKHWFRVVLARFKNKYFLTSPTLWCAVRVVKTSRNKYNIVIKLTKQFVLNIPNAQSMKV